MKRETQYALIENGSIHSDWLTIEQANEMLERHSRIFPDVNWCIVPMSECKDREKLKGFLDRHRESAIKYHS